MIVYINGQDIGHLVLGIGNTAQECVFTVYETSPEGFLAQWKRFMNDQQLKPSAVEKIVIVAGPGSATSLRVSHVIANTLSFAWDIPLASLKKDPTIPDAACVQEIFAASLTPIAQPMYSSDPHITIKKPSEESL